MKQFLRTLSFVIAVAFIPPLVSHAQQSLTWEQVKAKFEATNPALKADALNVDEMKAAEITAFSRPNPLLNLAADGTQLVPHNGIWQPLLGTQYQAGVSYLHERDHKRDLRLESAKVGTQISTSQHDDLERNLLFGLRSAFVQILQAKTILDVSKNDLKYYDKIIEISRYRFKDGDLAQIDLDRIELLRVQYEVQIENATVSLRSAKIQLLQLIDDRTPVDQFDVTGDFDWKDALDSLDVYHKTALQNRPDLQAAMQTIEQSKAQHKLANANGSTDPTLGTWYTYNPSFNNPNDQQAIGLSVNIPLRIFDHNQGEKKRTQIDIERSQQSFHAATAQIFSDVDTAYEQMRSNIELLKPYKKQYNDQALRVRDTVSYSYQHGGASLMDFLNAQSDFRIVQLAYIQLVGSYLTAAGQLNLAVGQEVIQ